MAPLLLEALDAAQAAALVQKVIDPEVVELQQRTSPLLANIPREPWNSTTYFFNSRTQYAEAGAVSDGGARPVGQSTWTQNSYDIKNLQVVGGVTGFAQAVTSSYIGNLRAAEIEGSSTSLNWAIETLLGWGNKAATANGPYPQFDGLDSLVDDFTSQYYNAIDFGEANFDTGVLDTLINTVQRNGRAQNPLLPMNKYAFICSPTIESRVAQLLNNQQRFNANMGNVGSATIAGGLVVATWRNIPFIPSSYLDPTGTSMGTVTTATGTTGGTLAAATYFYKVAAVINYFGETQVCPEVSQATTGSTSTVTLSFTAPTGPDGYSTILYKVYRSTATGTETLLGVVDAAVGLAADGISPVVASSIVDTGSALIPAHGATQPSTLPTVYFEQNAGLKPMGAGGQNMYLIPLNKNTLVRPFVREGQMIDLYPTTSAPDTLPFAIVGDTCLALRSGRWVARGTNIVCDLAV